MAKLTFSNNDVLRVMEHALAAESHTMGFADDRIPQPAFLLVKDDGIYLMSNGTPGDVIDKDSNRHFVAYAKGYDPRTGDVWHKCRAAVGGDDFAETIKLDSGQFIADLRAGADLVVYLTESQIRLATILPVSNDDVRNWLADNMRKSVLFFPTPRHKKLRCFKAGTPADMIRARYPKAVILNDLSLDDAVTVYNRRQQGA